MAPQRPSSQPFSPVPVGDLELSDTTPVVLANELGQCSVLVRLHGVPIGRISNLTGTFDGSLRDAALEQFHDELTDHLRQDGLLDEHGQQVRDLSAEHPCSYRLPDSSHRASVVLCTLGEHPRLAETVASLLDQTHRELELVVVDNHPSSGRVTAALAGIGDPRLRIVPEHRRGLSVARNTGLAAVTSSFVAYTDDDAVADPSWLQHLLAPFEESPDIACVTGLVLPAELATPAQLWFEEFGAFDKGFDRVVWSNRPDDEAVAGLGTVGEGGVLFPYSAGVYGSGNNMAFRVDWLRAHGSFDEALGAGTLTRGGEDLDAFLAVMLADQIIVYEPQALVRHYGRPDMAGLRKQMYGYGSGMCALIVKHVLGSSRERRQILVRVGPGLEKLLHPASTKNESRTQSFPLQLTVAELWGYVAGPALYLRSVLKARQSAGAAG